MDIQRKSSIFLWKWEVQAEYAVNWVDIVGFYGIDKIILLNLIFIHSGPGLLPSQFVLWIDKDSFRIIKKSLWFIMIPSKSPW